MPTAAPSPTRQRALQRARRQKQRFFLLYALLVVFVFLFSSCIARLITGEESPLSSQARIVVIDAGHGGEDQGATGVDGVRECDLTRATAQALWDLLEADPDITPIMCRDDWDQDLPAADRARRVQRSKATLSLSIHMNSDGGTGEASGFECFPATADTPYSEESLRFADLIASEMEAAGARLRGSGGVRYAYYEEDGSRVIRERGDTNPEGLRSFAMVNSTGCPAVLAEQCFITNADDLAAFGSEEGIQKAARCYYRAIRQYYGLPAEPAADASSSST